jgi:hypothetical protein
MRGQTMSDDYQRGRSGEMFSQDGDESAFRRGQADRAAADQPGGRMMDTSGVHDAGVMAGQSWARDSNRHLFKLFLELIIFPVIVGAIAYGVASYVGPPWFNSEPPLAVAITAAGIVFWLLSFIGWGQLLGASIGARRFHLPTVLVWLALSFVIVYGFKTAIIDSFVNSI